VRFSFDDERRVIVVMRVLPPAARTETDPIKLHHPGNARTEFPALSGAEATSVTTR
jgi:hypothetical protein